MSSNFCKFNIYDPCWRHQIETFSALLALCVGIHRWPVNSPHKGQWRRAVMFSLVSVGIKGWINNGEVGRAHYDVTMMPSSGFCVLCVISYYLRCDRTRLYFRVAWLRHEIETLLPLLAICEDNLSGNSGFSSQKASSTDFSLFIGYGVRENASSSFQIYLDNWKQFASYNGAKSDIKKCKMWCFIRFHIRTIPLPTLYKWFSWYIFSIFSNSICKCY